MVASMQDRPATTDRRDEVTAEYVQVPVRRDLVDKVIVFQARLIEEQPGTSPDAQATRSVPGVDSLEVVARYMALPADTRRVHDYLVERAGQWVPLQELQEFIGRSIRGMFSGMSRRLKHRFGTTD